MCKKYATSFSLYRCQRVLPLLHRHTRWTAGYTVVVTVRIPRNLEVVPNTPHHSDNPRIIQVGGFQRHNATPFLHMNIFEGQARIQCKSQSLPTKFVSRKMRCPHCPIVYSYDSFIAGAGTPDVERFKATNPLPHVVVSRDLVYTGQYLEKPEGHGVFRPVTMYSEELLENRDSRGRRVAKEGF